MEKNLKPEKILEKARSNPKDVKFNDLDKLLKYLGFTHERTTGSHRFYTHPDVQEIINLQKEKHGKSKPYQVRQVLKLVDRYNLKIGDSQ